VVASAQFVISNGEFTLWSLFTLQEPFRVAMIPVFHCRKDWTIPKCENSRKNVGTNSMAAILG
tara:strand:- start:60020 stop:60208 length:189 start_codon:yes stop_codon:yes gene_type:complete